MEDSIFGFDPTLMFASTKYNELAAESYRDELRKLDFSPSARVRSFSHFLGQHSPEEISNILSRHYLVAETEASMRSLGYRVCEFGDFLWNDVIECLELYRSKYGDVNVPNSYVIRSSEKFPRRYTGMKLGAFVEGLKIGDFDGLYDEERQRKLEDLGFVWGDMSKYLHFRFTPYLLALRVYTHLHDFLLPDDDFVIPNEPQWPIWMVGLPFGKWTNNIRIQKKVIEKFYPERKAMLDSLDFTWWVPITFIPPELQK